MCQYWHLWHAKYPSSRSRVMQNLGSCLILFMLSKPIIVPIWHPIATSIGQISRCSTHREIHMGIQPFKNIQMKCGGFMWKIVMPQLDLNGVSRRMHLWPPHWLKYEVKIHFKLTHPSTLELCVEEHNPICNVDFGQLVSNKINNDGMFVVENNFIPHNCHI